jgi:hypothetical protein
MRIWHDVFPSLKRASSVWKVTASTGQAARFGRLVNRASDLVSGFRDRPDGNNHRLYEDRVRVRMTDVTGGQAVPDDLRLRALMDAESQAMALLEAIEDAGIIRPGRSEQMVERDIFALAEQSFGVKQHWHKRIVRSGINTLRIFADDPPVRDIEEDDTVFLDLGPVFEAWEADVGRTYAIRKSSGCVEISR